MKISKSSTILKFVIFLAATTILPVFIMTGNVFAAVGDGGSGGASGSGPEAHWTNRGWGWAIYQTSGPGPQEPFFRNGKPWTEAKAQCQSENANTVTMHIIYDSYGKGMVYDYKSSQDGPPMYSAHFTAGSLVDGGRATAIDTPDARARFDALPAGERAGFTFGNNVGWFCTDRGPSESPNASCAITSYPSSVTPGQSFSATFSISNTGNTVWSVDPSVPDRFKLGSQSPQDNNTWGATRKEIAGVASGYGYVVYNGTQTNTWPNPATFTAPSTPGTYSFAWRVLREGVSWYGSTCSVPIIVTPPPAPTADCMPPWNNPVRTVILPNGGAPSGNGHTEVVSYTNRTQVENVRDEWGQYNSSYTDTGNNSVSVDYRPWFSSYKYDYHTPIVRYRAEYKVDYYDHHIHSYTYSCDPPGPATSGTCTGSYHEDHYTGSSTGWGSPQETSGERSLCRYRNFQFIDTGSQPSPKTNGVQWQSNPNANEEPNYVSFGTHYDVRFTLNYGVTPLRTQMRINYSASAVYQRDRNGVRTAWPYGRHSAPTCNNLFTGSSTIGNTGVPATLTADYRDCFVALVSPPTLQAGDRACFTHSLGYAQGELNPEGNIVSSSGSRSFSDCSEQIVDKPYVRVFGGDVIAGTTAFNSCVHGPGQINTWNRGSKPANAFYGNSLYGGSGTQLAAYASGAIDQFVSAATRGSNPVVPRGLTFANNTAATYGGNWATGNIPCQTDYYATGAPAGATDPGGSLGLNGANGIYRHSGNMTIGGSSNSNNIPPNRKIVVYVDGDLAITGDIRFVGMYSGIDRVTSVRIIVRGNIYIAPNVQYIDGILIAQPNGGTGGTIVTCSNGSYGLPTVAQVNGGAPSCRNRLEVFGALIAREVRFLRSQGSIRNSNNGHNYNNSTIAESIIFTPEVWLADPAYKPPYREPYEAFTSLPPIL